MTRKYVRVDSQCSVCGVMRPVLIDNLRAGRCKICFKCSQKTRKERMTIHGGTKRSGDSRLYHAWHKMKERCTKPLAKDFKDYGGRGINICERWKEFKNFSGDMGCRPEGKSIGRIDNNGPYSPDNCRWENAKEQASNKRTTIFVTLNGNKITLIDAVNNFSNLSYFVVYGRLKNGWEIEKALQKPKRKIAWPR